MLNWGGKNWRPGAPSNRRQPINQSIEELMKPLGEKTFQGNVWGSVIMNVPQDTVIPTPPFAGVVLIGNTAYDACNGLLYSAPVSGDSSSFCSSNTFINTDGTLSGFNLTTGVYYIFDYDGLTGVKSVNYVNGDDFFTYDGNCESCPVTSFVLNGVSDATSQTESPTYYSFDGVTFVASTTFSTNLTTTNTYVQYNEETGYWTTVSDGPAYIFDSPNGVTFNYPSSSYTDNPPTSIAKGLSGYNFAFAQNINGPNVPLSNGLTVVPSYSSTIGGCGSGANSVIFVDFGSSNVMWLGGPAGCTGDSYAINQNSDPTVDAWTAQTGLTAYVSPQQFASDYNSATTQDTKVVVVGSGAAYLAAVTTDGLNWTGETSSLTSEFNQLNCVIWDGTKFIAGGSHSALSATLPLFATSTDGISWTINTGSTSTTLGVDYINSIAFDGTTYIAIGINNVSVTSKVFSSPDGFVWTDTSTSFPPEVIMYKVDSNPHPYRR